ncbi:MAG: AbrB/MazE/SpoVT family DNA-binding domain-containing protein [Candidatus Andersenbacteria bacterium]
MKVGEFAKPNKKGQIVIPKKYRDELGISDEVSLNIVRRGNGLYMYPIKEVGDAVEAVNDAAYMKILNKTQGSWADDSWEDTSKEQAEIEKKAAKRAKKAW